MQKSLRELKFLEGFGKMDLRGFEPLTSSMRTRRAPNCATDPNFYLKKRKKTTFLPLFWKWRGHDSNVRPQGYEPCELPGCSTPRYVPHQRPNRYYRNGAALSTQKSIFDAFHHRFGIAQTRRDALRGNIVQLRQIVIGKRNFERTEVFFES